MPRSYLVHVKSRTGDYVETLQAIADNPEQAAAAVRTVVEPDAIVEAEQKPVSLDSVVEADLLRGKPRLG